MGLVIPRNLIKAKKEQILAKNIIHAKIYRFWLLFKFFRMTSPIGCKILVPYSKMEIFRYDKADFLKIHLVIPKNLHFYIGNKDLASYGASHPKKLEK